MRNLSSCHLYPLFHVLFLNGRPSALQLFKDVRLVPPISFILWNKHLLFLLVLLL